MISAQHVFDMNSSNLVPALILGFFKIAFVPHIDRIAECTPFRVMLKQRAKGARGASLSVSASVGTQQFKISFRSQMLRFRTRHGCERLKLGVQADL